MTESKNMNGIMNVFIFTAPQDLILYPNKEVSWDCNSCIILDQIYVVWNLSN